MDKELVNIVEQMMVSESKIVTESSEKTGTVKSNLKPGKGFDGAEKKAKDMGPDASDAKDAKDADEKYSNRMKGKHTVKEKRMLPQSKFDSLLSTVIAEADEMDIDSTIGTDESPIEATGNEGFDDAAGDFPEGDTESEDLSGEVDTATELRMIIDRLTEIADKLGGVEEEVEDAEEGLEGTEEPTEDMGDVTPAAETNAVRQEAVEGDGKLKTFADKKATMQSKGNMKVKSAFDVTSRSTGKPGGPGKEAADGKLKPFKKSKFGPKMCMKADVKGPAGKPGSKIFDSV